MKTMALLAFFFAAACSNTEVTGDSVSSQNEAAEPSTSPPPASSVAAFFESSEVRLIVTDETHSGEIAGVARGETRADFYWFSVSFPLELSLGESPIYLDFSDSRNAFSFEQNYYGNCNPSDPESKSCFIYERYQAGDAGLTGRGALTLTNDVVQGSIEISWEGMTDRFGEPKQWHQHSTTANFRSTVIDIGLEGAE